MVATLLMITDHRSKQLRDFSAYDAESCRANFAISLGAAPAFILRRKVRADQSCSLVLADYPRQAGHISSLQHRTLIVLGITLLSNIMMT